MQETKQGYYQVLGNDGSVELRVAIGRLGFRKEFDKKSDPLFSRILTFCNARKYVKIMKVSETSCSSSKHASESLWLLMFHWAQSSMFDTKITFSIGTSAILWKRLSSVKQLAG
jgi:hypothetical protein